MKGKNQKKRKSLLFVISIITIILVSGLLAYLTDRDSATNKFTIGQVKIKLQEPTWDAALLAEQAINSSADKPAYAEDIRPDETIAKDPQVRNVGRNDAYVYLRVTVPKATVLVEGQSQEADTELFSYTINSGWTEIADAKLIKDDSVTYTYYYTNAGTSNVLSSGETTGTLFDEVTFANIVDLSSLDIEQQILVEAYAIQSNNLPTGTDVTNTEWVESWIEEAENTNPEPPTPPAPPVGQSLKSQITSNNYGDAVNYSVTVSGVTLNNWKIFGVDGDNVLMIYGDYLPNTTNLGATAGLTKNGTYCLYSNTSRDNLMSRLKNTTAWSGLLTTELSAKGATAKGALTLDQYVASWNAKGYTQLYTKTNGTGYLISTNSSVGDSDYYVNMSSDTTGYADTLYYPHQSGVSDCYGYWLASPSAYSANCVMYVTFSGYVSYSYYYTISLGVRPVVSLPSSVLGTHEANNSWTIE